MAEGIKLTRRILMDMAKTIRNLDYPNHVKLEVGLAVADFFTREYMFFDRKTFLNIVTASIHFDPKTEKFTKVELKDGKV